MSKRRFSETERVAVFKAHNGKCHFCSRPCTLDDMHVDHVIPERLLASPDELGDVLALFGLPTDFNLNSFENWAPIHPRCNIEKSDTIYVPTLMMQHVIERAQKRGAEARVIAETASTNAIIARAKSDLLRAAEKGLLSQNEIERLSTELLAAGNKRDLEFMGTIFANVVEMRATFEFDIVADNIKMKVTANKNGVSITAELINPIKIAVRAAFLVSMKMGFVRLGLRYSFESFWKKAEEPNVIDHQKKLD